LLKERLGIARKGLELPKERLGIAKKTLKMPKKLLKMPFLYLECSVL
jgi:hypothetical protein